MTTFKETKWISERNKLVEAVHRVTAIGLDYDADDRYAIPNGFSMRATCGVEMSTREIPLDCELEPDKDVERCPVCFPSAGKVDAAVAIDGHTFTIKNCNDLDAINFSIQVRKHPPLTTIMSRDQARKIAAALLAAAGDRP